MHRINWCEEGMKLEDISTKNIGENDLNPRIKYIMVRLDNRYIKLVQEGWHNKGWSTEQEFCINRLYWVGESTKSVWKCCIKVGYMKRTLKNVCSRSKTMLFWTENSVGRKPRK